VPTGLQKSLPGNPDLPQRFNTLAMFNPRTKNKMLSSFQKLEYAWCVPLLKRGASRSSRTLVRDAVGVSGCSVILIMPTNNPMRTVKSCGSGLPVLRPRSRTRWVGDRRGQDSRSPGRSRIHRKTIAQGMPGCSAGPVVTAACFFSAGGPWARPTPGIPCALFSQGATQDAKLGRVCAARRESVSRVRSRRDAISTTP
jgi:hypothetical protein